MDLYMLGKFALPVVIGIMAAAAILTIASGIFTTLKTLSVARNFFQQLEETRQHGLTINANVHIANRQPVHPGRRSFRPPMQEENHD